MSRPIYILDDNSEIPNKSILFEYIMKKNNLSKIFQMNNICIDNFLEFKNNISSGDIIIAIGDGGMRVLSSLNSISKIENTQIFLHCERKFINGERIGYRIDKEKLLKLPKGSNIILVEDIVDSGQTLSELKKYLGSSNIKYIFCILNIGNYSSSNFFSCYSSIFLNTDNVFSLRHLIYGEKTSNFHTEINKYFFDNDVHFLELIDEATNVT